jgi:hypothetical protein
LDDTPTQPFKKSRPKKTVKFDKKAVPAGPAGDYSLKTPGLFKIPAMERDFYDHYRKVHARAVVESNWCRKAPTVRKDLSTLVNCLVELAMKEV